MTNLTTTLNSKLSSAEICRRNGWEPGACLRGKEGCRWATITITAVGERSILARSDGGRERNWTLACRDWREVQ